MTRSKIFWIVALLIIIGGCGVSGYAYQTYSVGGVSEYLTPEEEDVYVRFGMEVFDTVQEQYWEKVEEKAFAELFKLSAEKALGGPVSLATTTRSGVASMLASVIATASSTSAKAELVKNITIVALSNLQPVGRMGLMSQKQETELRQNVSNINPEKDLYSDLGLTKGASVAAVADAFEEKSSALANATTTEDKEELARAEYAYEVLTKESAKALYDEAKIEPTLNIRTLGKTMYLNLTKISPSSFQEFGLAIEAASTTPGMDSLIIDVRGNVGGALDFAQAFIGLFTGQNQYAFDLYRQGDFKVQRTTFGFYPPLERYKEVAILTDDMTQSTAEVITAAFKRQRLGYVVGGTTRGWGTVENTFPIETSIDPTESYTLFLVHSITLRDDNQPIEGRGVTPDIDITDPSWKDRLSDYFRSQSLIKALKETAAKPPLQN